MNNKLTRKEHGLLKGALRRIFSRSDLRKSILSDYAVKPFIHPEHLRVTRWAFCGECGLIFPAYRGEVDHIDPVMPLGLTLEDMSVDELIERIWCDRRNLVVLDKDCHKTKTKLENKKRREFKKQRGVK